jgi:hypothetical protein
VRPEWGCLFERWLFRSGTAEKLVEAKKSNLQKAARVISSDPTGLFQFSGTTGSNELFTNHIACNIFIRKKTVLLTNSSNRTSYCTYCAYHQLEACVMSSFQLCFARVQLAKEPLLTHWLVHKMWWMDLQLQGWEVFVHALNKFVEEFVDSWPLGKDLFLKTKRTLRKMPRWTKVPKEIFKSWFKLPLTKTSRYKYKLVEWSDSITRAGVVATS